jgi:hypothetical protein
MMGMSAMVVAEAPVRMAGGVMIHRRSDGWRRGVFREGRRSDGHSRAGRCDRNRTKLLDPKSFDHRVLPPMLNRFATRASPHRDFGLAGSIAFNRDDGILSMFART